MGRDDDPGLRSHGHRELPHTADVAVEAWGPDFGSCVAETVSAVVESFVEGLDPGHATTVAFDVPAGPPQDALVAVLDELVYRVDVHGTVPVSSEVTGEPADGVRVTWRMADPERVRLVGAVPKGVSLHDLVVQRDERGWRCRVVLDV